MTDPNRLLDRYLDDQLSPAQLKQLEHDLASNPRYADAFASAMMIDALLEDRFEQETITNMMQLQDGSFLGEEDLSVLQDDYDHAVTHTVTLVDLKDKPSRIGKDDDAITASQAYSVLSYAFKQAVRTHPKPFVLSAAGMVAAALLLALILFNPFASDAPDTVAELPEEVLPSIDVPATARNTVATLTASRDAQWQGASGTALPDVGDELLAGQRLTLVAGVAEITTHDGAIAILEAPATVELLDNDNAIRLHTGKLVGICETDSSKGFLVRTPHLNVTDLGTRFGVDVTRGLATEVHVHQGEVVVAPTNAPATKSTQKQIIIANQAVRSVGAGRAITAIAPAFEKFAEALRTYRLRGTGLHLAEGDVDPHWLVVADGNGKLDMPLPVVVQYSGKDPRFSHYPAVGNDPAVAQWLFFSTGNIAYYPFDTPAGIDSTRLTFASTFQLPDTAELEGKVLYLRFASPEGIHELRINGRAIEGLPRKGQFKGEQLFHEVELPVDQANLQPGENRIEIDLSNNITSGLASFYLQWALRPVPSTTQAAP